MLTGNARSETPETTTVRSCPHRCRQAQICVVEFRLDKTPYAKAVEEEESSNGQMVLVVVWRSRCMWDVSLSESVRCSHVKIFSSSWQRVSVIESYMGNKYSDNDGEMQDKLQEDECESAPAVYLFNDSAQLAIA